MQESAMKLIIEQDSTMDTGPSPPYRRVTQSRHISDRVLLSRCYLGNTNEIQNQ